ncbi:hypothetical protein GGI07_001934 [Coemansia sp. Benny D115]|nr:hypothetical protein GGI07_001934 [Coemansia sp. Benny D115]
MADYAWTVWKAQPTRTFVPVFLIHGTKLTLFVFARSKHYRIDLGQFMYTSDDETLAWRRGITKTLHRLWFLLIQPPERFGHFVDISNDPQYLVFKDHEDRDSVASARKTTNHDSAVDITKRIHKSIALTRRAAYLFDTTYEGNRAVLKLSWSPSNRQPEGAIYDILSANNVSNIPEIYRSGILIRDIFGFRLEYIIMSHCGESVEEWFNRSNQSTSSERNLNDDVHRIVQKVTTCLVQARKAGVLHRDISAGNIMITDSSVSVIDWGYSRAIGTVQTWIKNKINKKWGIDIAKITCTEKKNDGNTGTPCYMGVRILMKQATRCLLDDMESLFYIVMALFSAIDRKSMDLNAPGFMVPRSNLAAALKVGFLSDDKNFPEHFGIKSWTPDEYQYLEAFRRLLFFAENKFIGGNLLTSTEQIRTADYGDVIKALLDPEHSQQCSDYQPPSDEHPQRSVANNDVAEPNAPMPVTVIIENAPTLVQTTALVQIDHHSHNSIVEPAKQHYSEAAALVTASWQPDVSRSESVPQAPHALQGASRLLSEQMKKHIEFLAWDYSISITDRVTRRGYMKTARDTSEFTMPYHCTAQYLLLIEESLAEFTSFSDRVVFILVALHLHTSAIPPSAESGFNNSGTRNAPHDPRAQTNQSLASEIGRMGLQSVATSVSVADKENVGSRCFNSSPKRSFADTGFDTPIHPGATSSNKSRRIEGN